MGSLTPNFTRLHDPYCNCFDCGTNSVDGVINDNTFHDINNFDFDDLKLYSQRALGYINPVFGTANDVAITTTLAVKKAMADAGKPLSEVQLTELHESNKLVANKVISETLKDNLFSITKWIVIGIVVLLVINITLKKFL